MTAFSESFRSEVARIARKENKGEMSSLRKTATNQRAEIATLKRDLKDLAGQVRSLAKALQKSLTAAERQQPRRQSPDSSAGTPAAANRRGRAFVFSHEALVAKRQAFHMTQKEMAQLLGVSSLSVGIPGAPSFAGKHLFWQAALLTPGANPVNVLLSNGLDSLLNLFES